MRRERRIIVPNFHLRMSLSIIRLLATWLPLAGKYRSLYLLYVVCNFIFIVGIILVAEIASVFANWPDMSKIIPDTPPIILLFIHASKMLVFLRHQKQIQALLDTANSSAFSRYDKAYQDLLRYYTWKGIFHYATYQISGTISVFCWSFTPIADLIAGRSRQLLIEGWYPYNITTTPVFEITLVHQVIAIITVQFHDVAMDTLITGLITVACCQLAILERNIISIDNEKSTEQRDKTESCMSEAKVSSYQQLKQCAVHSNMIYRFTREIQDIFGIIIFFQFFSNCLIICFMAFNISQMKVYIPVVLIGMITYICFMTYQIFIFCWHGNELHLHSIRIVTAAYLSNWFSGTEEFKRGLQIVMMRAHRPFSLTAGNIMILSLKTFVEIMRMSYSIYMVLQSTANCLTNVPD